MFSWMLAFHSLWIALLWGGTLALFVLGVYLLLHVTTNRTTNSSAVSSDRALDILRERYARGELSKEDFVRMRDDLRGGR